MNLRSEEYFVMDNYVAKNILFPTNHYDKKNISSLGYINISLYNFHTFIINISMSLNISTCDDLSKYISNTWIKREIKHQSTI